MSVFKHFWKYQLIVFNNKTYQCAVDRAKLVYGSITQTPENHFLSTSNVLNDNNITLIKCYPSLKLFSFKLFLKFGPYPASFS